MPVSGMIDNGINKKKSGVLHAALLFILQRKVQNMRLPIHPLGQKAYYTRT